MSLVDDIIAQRAGTSLADQIIATRNQPKGKLTTALESIDESTVLGQIAGGAARPLAAGLSAAAFNIPETVFGEVPQAKSLVETGVTAVARAAGFIAGGPIKLAKFTLGTKLLPTREGIRAVGQMMARAGAELGLASGYSSIAPAIKYAESIPQGLHEVATNALEGAAVGVTFPLAGAIPNKLLRVAAGVLAADKIRAGLEQGFTIDDTVKSVVSWAKGAEVSDEEKQKLIHDLTGTFIDMYFFSKVPELRKTLMALKENRLAKEILATRVGDMESVIDSLGKGKVATMTEGGAKVEGVQIDQDVANMADAIKTETTKVVDPTVEPFKFDPNSTKNEGRWRLKNPAEFDTDTYFRRKSSTPGISYVMGLNKATGAVEEQAVRFDRHKFNTKSASKWWDANKNRFTRTWSWTGKPGSDITPAPDPSREVDLTTEEGRQAYIDTIEPSKLSLEDTLKDRAARNQAEIERAMVEEKEPAAMGEPTVPEIDVEGLRQEADALEREADDVNRFVFDRQMEGKEPIKTKDIVNIIKEAEPSVLDKISTKGIVNIVDKIRDGDKNVIAAAEMYRRALEGRGPFLDANDKLYLRYVGAELDKIQMIEMPMIEKRDAELVLVKAIGETKPPKATKAEKKELLGVPLPKGKPREVKPKEEGPTLEQAELVEAEAPTITKYEVGPTEPAPWMQSALDSIWAAKSAFIRGAPQAAAKALVENVPADGIKEFARSVGVSKYDIAKVDDPLSRVGTEWLANRIINKIVTSDTKPELQMVEAEPTPDWDTRVEPSRITFDIPTEQGHKRPLSQIVREYFKEKYSQDVDYIRDFPKNKLFSGPPFDAELMFRMTRVALYNLTRGTLQFAKFAQDMAKEFNLKLTKPVVDALNNAWERAKAAFETLSIGRTTLYTRMENVMERSLPNVVSPTGLKSLVEKWSGREFSPEDAKWSGLDEFIESKKSEVKINKEEVLRFLRENNVEVEENIVINRSKEIEDLFISLKRLENKVNAEPPKISVEDYNKEAYLIRKQIADIEYDKTPKYEEYTLPGGSNYRELLLTLPNIDSSYQSPHWKEPNPFAHARLKDRNDVNGKRVLFIEEIQSDWAGARKRDINAVELTQSIPQISEAPYLKNWHELTLRRLLRMAAEEGYDKLAWNHSLGINFKTGLSIEKAAALYDKMVPDYLNRFSKGFGSTVDSTKILLEKGIDTFLDWLIGDSLISKNKFKEVFQSVEVTKQMREITPVTDVEAKEAANAIKDSFVKWLTGGGSKDITLSFLGGREWKIDPEVKRNLHKIGIYLYRKGLRDVESWKKGFQQLAGPAFNDRLDDIYTASKGLAQTYELSYNELKKYGDPDRVYDQRLLNDGTKKVPIMEAEKNMLGKLTADKDEQLYKTSAGPIRKSLEAIDNVLGTDAAGMMELEKYAKIWDPSIFIMKNIDRAFGTPFKTLLLDNMSVAATNSRKELTEIADTLEMIRKTHGLKDINRIRIGTQRLSEREGGKEGLERMGIKQIPELTDAEKVYDRTCDKIYDNLLTRMNEVRVLVGEEPIPKVANYQTFMRVFKDLVDKKYDVVKIDANKFIKALQTPFPFKDAKRSDLPLELDVEHIVLNYSKYALNYIHKTPILAKAREYAEFTWKEKVPAKEEGKFKSVERGMSVDAPATYEIINRWINYQAGIPRNKIWDDPAWDSAARKLTRNLGASIMLFNFRVAVIQPLALDAVVAKVGVKHFLNGLRMWATSKQHRQMAEQNSNELSVRSPETVMLDAMSDIAFAKGTGTFKERVDAFMDSIRQKGWKPTIASDMVTAKIAWLSGYSEAMAKGMSNTAAFRYADDVLIETQGSAAPHHIADIQRHSAGRVLTLFNTFVINRAAWLRNDVLKPIAGKGGGLSEKDAYKTLFRFMVAMTATNILFEDILGVRSPNPTPIRAFKERMETDDDFAKAAFSAATELAQFVPVAGGGLRYGSALLGPVPDYIGDVSQWTSSKAGGQYTGYIPPFWELAGKGLGVHGTAQIGAIVKAAKRAEKGEEVPPQQYILGRPSYQQK